MKLKRAKWIRALLFGIIFSISPVYGAAAAEGGNEPEELETIHVEEPKIPLSDSNLAVSPTFPSELVPEGFEKTEYAYRDTVIEGAKLRMGDLILLYLTDRDSGEGEFYVYHEASGAFSPLIQVKGIEGAFIVLLPAPEDIKVPEGFSRINIQWGGKTIPAYMAEGAEGIGGEHEQNTVADSGVNAGDFFLAYAVSDEGNEGFYLYDMKEGTYQRYLTAEFNIPEAAASKGISWQWLLTGAAVTLIILSFVFQFSKSGSGIRHRSADSNDKDITKNE